MTVIATRREKVILELQDDFSSEMARAAVATALLDKNLNRLSGNAVRSQRSIAAMGRNDGLPALSRNSAAADRSINQLTGRLQLMAQAAAVLGPALVPIGAAAIPALAGMATQLALTGAAAGVAVAAFQGIGDGLEALNAYQIEPSVENFQKLQVALEDIGPAGAEFVRFLDSVGPQFEQLQMSARSGLFPGLQEGITNLLDLLPQMDRIVGNLADTMGGLAADATAGLSGEGFTAFFNYLESNARPILEDMGRTIGNFAEGLANMLVAFGPLTSDFSGGLLEMSRAFNEWTQGLADSRGFQDFIDYVRDAGPRVIDLIGSIADAFVQIVQAVAPLGNVVLPALTAMFDVVAKLADSPLGTMFFTAAAGLAAFNRAATLTAATSAKLGIAGTTGLARFNAIASRIPQAAAGIGMVGLALTDVDDKMGLSNTAMLGLAGTMAGPWGAAVGAGAGLLLDFKAANDQAADSAREVTEAMVSGTREQIQALLERKRAELATLQEDRGDFWTDLNPMDNLNAITGDAGKLQNQIWALQDSLRSTAGPADLMASAIGKTAAQMEAAERSASDLAVSMSNLMGLFDRRAAMRGAAESLAALRAELRDGAKVWDINTKAGRENQGALDDWAVSMLRASEQIKNVGARRNFLDNFRDQLVGLRKDFPDAAGAIGRVIRALDNQLDDLGRPRKPIKPEVEDGPARRKLKGVRDDLERYDGMNPRADLDANDKPAKGKISSTERLLRELVGGDFTVIITADPGGVHSGVASANSALNSIAGRTVTTFINTVRNVVPGGSSAYGNIFEAYANGDVRDRHQPELYKRPVTRIWGEPETGGEAYIPLRNDSRRPRAKSILEETASILGGQVAWYAQGGRNGGRGGQPDNAAAGVGNDLRDAGRGAKELKQRLREATRELERETKSRERLRGWAEELRSSVSGSFDNDIFGSGLSGLKLQLEADRNDARAMKTALQQAKKKGLDGGLFAELAASGDLNTAQQIAAMGRGGIGQIERLFQQTNQAQSGLAGFAVNTQFGKELRESNRERRHLIRVVNKLENRLKDLDKKVEKGARAGVGDRDRKTSARVRVGGKR